MLDLLLWNGRVLSQRDTMELGHVGIAAGRIVHLGECPPPQDMPARRRLDMGGSTLVPGLIDLHAHGAKGHDTMDATAAALEGMARFAAQHGVTAFLAATMASTPEALAAALANVHAHMGRHLDGARLLGAYVEGPFLSSERAGAHDASLIRPPSGEEIDAVVGSAAARAVTVAPDVPGALVAIERLAQEGIVVALGHTMASYEQMEAACQAGATLVTHLFNAMAPLHHRRPGPIGAALTLEGLICELIADLVHVHPAVLHLALRAKGLDGIVLVTDAMRGAGLPDGDYSLGGLPVTVAEGSARLEDGRLAGSVLTMDQAVRNMMDALGLGLQEAWSLGSATPARVLGLAESKGAIAEGLDADLVICDSDGNVRVTIVGGKVVYEEGTLLVET